MLCNTFYNTCVKGFTVYEHKLLFHELLSQATPKRDCFSYRELKCVHGNNSNKNEEKFIILLHYYSNLTQTCASKNRQDWHLTGITLAVMKSDIYRLLEAKKITVSGPATYNI